MSKENRDHNQELVYRTGRMNTTYFSLKKNIPQFGTAIWWLVKKRPAVWKNDARPRQGDGMRCNAEPDRGQKTRNENLKQGWGLDNR